ncbi:MAG: dTDP-4-dehydrorhamnose reductase [Planctomycetota bacterium]|nr:MAG: dTDP-4-dehydrorhamnose reductase [Planctomycetota bacterium]
MVSNDATITILGGRGMLGFDLASVCELLGIKTTVLDLPDFDITSFDQLQRAVADAKIIVNCAAYTNVDKAEREPDLAYQVNAEAVGRLGVLAREADVWVLHISTDFVFDGKSDRPYVETDPPNPINTYGASKLAGEKLLVESRCHHCIMRLEWTYGSHGNNFVSKLIKRARAAKSVKVVDDQIGSPTATAEAAKAICSLVSKKPEGVFHFASDGYVSRFDMAKFVFEKLSMSVDLASCKTSDFASPATRPLNSRFDCSKIKSLLDEPVKPWQQPLEQFLEQL